MRMGRIRKKILIGVGLTLILIITEATPPASAERMSTLRFDKPVALPNGNLVTEPSIAIDSKGRIYVSGPSGLVGGTGGATTVHPSTGNSPAWVSSDNGKSFKQLTIATLGPQSSRFGGGDTDVVVDKRDDVYVTDLWLGNDSISYSSDQGATWFGSPMSHRPFDDRNWLAYSKPDDAIYQIYDGLDGLWMTRTDLNGDPKNSIFPSANAPIQERPGFVFPPGHITVDQRNGDVYAIFTGQDSHMQVGKSTDKGMTWQVKDLSTSTLQTTNPQLSGIAVDLAGNVFASWFDKDHPVVSASYDGGAHWVTKQLPGGTGGRFPAITVLGVDHVGVAWMEPSQGHWRVRYADVSQVGSPSYKQVETTIDPNVFGKPTLARELGDFFSLATAPNGDVFVTYTSAYPAPRTLVARLPAGKR